MDTWIWVAIFGFIIVVIIIGLVIYLSLSRSKTPTKNGSTVMNRGTTPIPAQTVTITLKGNPDLGIAKSTDTLGTAILSDTPLQFTLSGVASPYFTLTSTEGTLFFNGFRVFIGEPPDASSTQFYQRDDKIYIAGSTSTGLYIPNQNAGTAIVLANVNLATTEWVITPPLNT